MFRDISVHNFFLSKYVNTKHAVHHLWSLTYLFYLNNLKITNKGFQSNVNCFFTSVRNPLVCFSLWRKMIGVSVVIVGAYDGCSDNSGRLYTIRYNCELVLVRTYVTVICKCNDDKRYNHTVPIRFKLLLAGQSWSLWLLPDWC